jgi:hypothetical protein
MTDSISRRDFLKFSAAGGAILAAGATAAGPAGAAEGGATTAPAGGLPATATAAGAAAAGGEAWAKMPTVKIHKVFIGRTGGYMARPTEEKGKLNTYLDELGKKLGVEFVGGQTIPPDKADDVAAQAAKADALLVIYLSGHEGDTPVLGKLFDAGVPAAMFFQPFGGHGWMYFQEWRKKNKNVILMSTSDWADLDRAVAMLRVPVWMKKTRILCVGGLQGTAAARSAEQVKKKLGAELVTVDNKLILEAAKAIDAKAAEEEAERYWISQAQKIVEPKRAEIIDSVRYYLAVKDLMIREKAQAIASSLCMGTPRGCLTFSKLNDLGLVGACEGDIDSTLTMLLMTYGFGVPGFITDPVIDTAKNAMIHFHCTSATKMDGPGGKRLPFVLRNQTDTGGGVAVQAENRIGQPVTCAKLVNLDTMLVCPGKIIEVSTSPLACRTQFTQTVRDARQLFLNWSAGAFQGGIMAMLHRVVFYGDYAKGLQELGDLMGFRVIEEGGPSAPAAVAPAKST